jgi:2'-5' RNA ligase
MPKSMIACYLPEEVAEKIEIPGYEKDGDLHLTLVYLGDISLHIDFEGLTEALEEWAETRSPILGKLGDISRFPANENTDGMDVAYLPFISDQLTDFRESLLQVIAPFGLSDNSDFDYTPHITLGYLDPKSPTPEPEYQGIEIAFSCICLCVGELHAEFTLLGATSENESLEESGDDIQVEDTENAESSIGRLYVGNSAHKFNMIASTNKPRALYWGAPTPDDLSRINQITGRTWEASDWQVVPFLISDNLMWRDKGKWHPNVLSQMPKEMVSRPIIYDHVWEKTESAVGVIIDCFITISGMPPENFVRDNATNQKIARSEKYRSVCALGAFYGDKPEVLRGLQTKRQNDVSTGSNIWNYQVICPECSQEYGFDVDIRSVDDKGRWVCPHLPPDFPSDSELQSMSYIVYNGVYDGIELSLVTAGNLPAAGAIR